MTADDCMEAAATAAEAQHTRPVDRHVGQLASRAEGAAVRLAMDDDAAADAGRELDVHDVPAAAPRGANRGLAEAGQRRVVAGDHRESQAAGEIGGRLQTGPAPQHVRLSDDASRHFDWRRQRGRHPDDPAAGEVDRPDHGVDQVDGRRHRAKRIISHPHGDVPLGQRVEAKVSDGSPDQCVLELDTYDPREVRIEAGVDRTSPGAGRRLAALHGGHDGPLRSQVIHQACDSCATQAGQPLYFAETNWAVVPDGVENNLAMIGHRR